MARIKIGISGLGLIGSSILKGLYDHSDYETFCHSNSSYKKALEYTKNSSRDINILKNCDIVFVCSKVSDTISTLEKLNSILDKNTIVADVCSIKKDLIDKKYNFNFILSHPMAGSETQGFDSGDSKLFIKAKWLIEKNNEILEKTIVDLGAIPLLINMKDHDKLTAQISHLPTLLSFLLFNTAQSEAKLIASSGFRDTTRLAISNPDLIINMFNLNLENIEKSFNLIQDEFNKLKAMTDSEKIEFFSEISKKRKEMYDKDGKNIFKL